VDEFIKNNIDDLTDDLTYDLLKEAKSADKVLIASGSHDFLVKGFAEYFGIEFSIGTPVEIKKDIFTGTLTGEPTFSDGKVKAVKNWCYNNNLKIEDSIFYSDSINDLPMLESCGEPIVVNPDDNLRKIAIDRSYKIINR
jgi:Haloacid Dehalogenase superfamily, subfamily IB, phosphoserine phosphatase-like